jgi:cell division protein FtsL
MMWVVVVVCAASLLYSVKYRVQTMDEEIAAIRSHIKEERAAIHVLKAEWAYLSRPERVRELAEKHLEMAPMDGKQMLELADLPYAPDAPVQLASGKAGAALPYGSAMRGAPIPQLRPGIIPAGGAGYVR